MDVTRAPDTLDKTVANTSTMLLRQAEYDYQPRLVQELLGQVLDHVYFGSLA